MRRVVASEFVSLDGVMEDPRWTFQFGRGEFAEEVSRPKQQPGRDILIGGSGELVNTLMGHDLIDEYRLMVFPVVVGSGKHLFGEGSATKTLQLEETKTFASGGVVLSYVPACDEEAW